MRSRFKFLPSRHAYDFSLALMRFIIVYKLRPIILKRNDCASIWMQSSVKTCFFFISLKCYATEEEKSFRVLFVFFFFFLLTKADKHWLNAKPSSKKYYFLLDYDLLSVKWKSNKTRGAERKMFLSWKNNGTNFSSWIEGFTRNQKFVEWKLSQVFHESINGH